MADSFGDVNREMGEARDFLRSFTLGRRGFTQRSGLEAIDRVNNLCEQLQEQFGSGQHASEAASTVVTARNQILAAKARLSVLRNGPVALTWSSAGPESDGADQNDLPKLRLLAE